MLRLLASTAAKFLLVFFPAVFLAPNTSAADSSLARLETGLTDLVFALTRSVVTVETTQRVATNRFSAVSDETYARELTTGIVIDTNGHILVAARPVLHKDRITIRHGERSIEAEIVAVDYQTEMALLRPAVRGGVPVRLSSHHACAGQMVVALSQTFGVRPSPSLGFCAGVRDDGSIQFSVPGLGGRAGAGVFDLNGRLLGFVAEEVGGNTGLVVAVPAYKLPMIIDHLLVLGDRYSGFAGITSQEIEISPGLPVPYPVVPASVGSQTNLIERGVVITSVVPSSPAALAGLMVGDLIFAVDRMPVNSAIGLANLVRQSSPGATLELDVLRRDRYLSIPLAVGRKSLDLSPTVQPSSVTSDQSRLVDSLKQALEVMREQIRALEHRLETLD
jgi:S1-C subfamily serine protease